MTATYRHSVVDTLKVRDPKDVEEVVRAAIASEQPLEIIGHGTRRLIGQPMATNAVLDVSALNAVSAYFPVVIPSEGEVSSIPCRPELTAVLAITGSSAFPDDDDRVWT